MHYSIVQQGDQLLAQQRSEGDTPDTALMATDQQRSVLQTVNSNHPPQPIAYSPYGHHPAESWLLSLLGFNGERTDPVSGHYLLGNGYRAFNPVLMRFNSPDSLSPFEKGGFNAYAYCGQNPINRKDPTGQTWFSVFIGAVRDFAPSGMGSATTTKVIKSLTKIHKETPTLTALARNDIERADQLFEGAIKIKQLTIEKMNKRVPTLLANAEDAIDLEIVQMLLSEIRKKMSKADNITKVY
jgi:RHS repeat-associated protein